MQWMEDEMTGEPNRPENNQSEVGPSGANEPSDRPAQVSGPGQEWFLGNEREPEIDSDKKWTLFVTGFLGWYGINGIFWLIVSLNPFYNLLILPVNVLALIIFALNRTKRWISLGILSALAVNLFISLVMSLQFNAICFIPFFIK